MLFCSLSPSLRQIKFCHVTPNFFVYWFFFNLCLTFEVTEKVQCEIQKKKRVEQWCYMRSTTCNTSIIYKRWQAIWILSHFPFALLCSLPQICCWTVREHITRGSFFITIAKWLVHLRLENIFFKKCGKSSLYRYFSAFQAFWLWQV